MATDRVVDFLHSLANNPQARKQLHDAVASDLVKAGKDAGYDFNESELDSVLQRVTSAGGPLTPAGGIGWS